MRMPSGLRLWTASEVVECLPLCDFLDRPEKEILEAKLYRFHRDAKDPTPLGGDGSDGTVETPCGRLDDRNDDKAPHWWMKLTISQQRAVADAYLQEFGCNV